MGAGREACEYVLIGCVMVPQAASRVTAAATEARVAMRGAVFVVNMNFSKQDGWWT